MSDPAAAVRGLLAEVDRAAAAFGAVLERTAEQSDARLREARQEGEALGKAEQSARTRAEQAEAATAILREEREVIREALRAVTGPGDAADEDSR